ncbi:MAG: hypothetical protein KatS3mg096_754 [Candidatus Parcubacteria bacterium]|nr:MAG: hypothetical protein KatS3mg096_754 [Candidatus Parcubacteria bacterium]
MVESKFMLPTNNQIPTTRQFELQTLDLTDWKEDEILEEIRKQFNYSKQVYDVKKRYWVEMIKLYLNQFRKQIADITLGSKLLFTQFHETYSSIDNDQRRVIFKPRRPQDDKITFYTNAVAQFDFDEMEMGRINRELIWDIIFFGIGILDVSLYDKKNSVLKPSVQSPFTFFIDPKTTSIDEARFAGRFIYKTYYDLINDSNLNSEKVKDWVKSGYAPTESSYEQTQLEKRAKQYLIGDNYFQEPLMSLSFLEILEWYFYANGKLWVVWTDNGITKVLGYKRVDYQDKGEKESKIPFITYNFIKTSFSLFGLGLPDLIEDLHRADVVLKNLMMRSIMLDATATFLANYRILLNPKDLLTKEQNKVIFTTQPPAGQILPFPKTQVVSNDTLAFINVLQNEAVGAVGSARILKGSLTQVKKTATEIAIAKAKQDLQISSIMRNIIAGEKDFWYRWLKRHQRFMAPDDKKLIEIVGYQGAKEFTSVKKREFIPEVDPRIEVVSSLEAEPQKILRRRELAEILQPLAQIGGNVREVVRTILYDMDLTPEQVDVFLPPTPHEQRAKLENEVLEQDDIVEIHENDDDLQHIAIHYRAKETDARNIHIHAHILNYLNKQRLQAPEQKQSVKEISQGILETETPEELGRELTQLPTEGVEALTQTMFPQTPSAVK